MLFSFYPGLEGYRHSDFNAAQLVALVSRTKRLIDNIIK